MLQLYSLTGLRASKPNQARLRIAEPRQLNAQLIQQREVQNAQLPVVIPGAKVIQDPPRLKRAAESPEREHREPGVVVAFAGPHVRRVEQAGILEDGAFTLGHCVQFPGEIRQGTDVATRDTLVGVGEIIVRRGMVRVPNIKKRAE